MKTSSRKLTLHRDTLRSLTPQALREANGGIINRGTYDCTLVVTCPACPTAGCPTRRIC